MELTKQEKGLIRAYRQADNRARYDAGRILGNNKRKTIPVSEILFIADLFNKTVDELLSDCQ